jgi:multidrug resistance efflux pump
MTDPAPTAIPKKSKSQRAAPVPAAPASANPATGASDNHASPTLVVRRMSWKRVAGLGAVAVILVLGLGYIGDNTLVLNADGLVLRDRLVAAAPYEARIKQIFVRSGDYVQAGDTIAILESASMSRNLAELAAQKARLTSTIAHLEARRAVVDALLPIAKANSTRLQDMVAELERFRDRGMTSLFNLQQITAQAYTANERLASLQAEGMSSEEELRQNRAAAAEMNAAYDKLNAMYADGILLAPASGYIGSAIVDSGEVLVPGRKVLEIYAGRPFVAAYLPDSPFISVGEGEDVRVSSAGKSMRATVEKILPIAEALPPEFQKPVHVRDRGQLLRIALTDEHQFVTEQKVRVTGCYIANCGDLASAAAQLTRKLEQQVFDWVGERYPIVLHRVELEVESIRTLAHQMPDLVRGAHAASMRRIERHSAFSKSRANPGGALADRGS